VKGVAKITHFQSNGRKASVDDLICSMERDKSLPSLLNNKKLMKDLESEKERETGRRIITCC